jgi:pimeloyl-ACP methyl ester carboxylesterase
LEAAPSLGVRVVALQRRGYGGSTPLTEDELVDVSKPDSPEEVHLAFNLRQARCIAVFVASFLQNNALKGPCLIVGWSMANRYTVPLLSPALELPEDVVAILEETLEAIVLYGELQQNI